MTAACDKAASPPNGPSTTTVSVTITGGGMLSHQGQTLQLKAIAHLSDGSQVDVTATANWKSHDTSIITISASGLVTAQAPGACNVEATSDGVKGQAKVEVLGSLLRVDITGVLTFSKQGDSSQLKAVAHYTGGSSKDVTHEATWSSSNQAVVAVNNTGTATAEGDGDCDITAVLGAVTGKVAAKVRIQRVISLRILGNLSLALLGQSSHLKAIATLSDGVEIDVTAQTVWSTSQQLVAKISVNGVLEAIGPGDCDVTALHAGVSARATVQVLLPSIKVIKLKLVGASLLKIGETLQLKAIAELSDGSEVDVTDKASWTTSNLLIAIVGKAGLLTALSFGDCDVLVVHAGVSAKLTVKVSLLE